jgi:hypothetical protein
MKKKKNLTKQVRISLEAWEQVRRVAFKRHTTMNVIVEMLVAQHL